MPTHNSASKFPISTWVNLYIPAWFPFRWFPSCKIQAGSSKQVFEPLGNLSLLLGTMSKHSTVAHHTLTPAHAHTSPSSPHTPHTHTHDHHLTHTHTSHTHPTHTHTPLTNTHPITYFTRGIQQPKAFILESSQAKDRLRSVHHTRTHTHTHTHTHSLTEECRNEWAIIHSHTHTHTHSLTHSHTQTHTHTPFHPGI